MRSVGSTGSQGSTRGYGHAVASHLVNGETRFPTATSYTSDAQRSDVATVCSGSVVEDIEVESVISADLNVQAPTSNPSPPSSVKMTVGPGSIGTSAHTANSPAANDPGHPFSSNPPERRIETVVPQKGLPVQGASNYDSAPLQQPDPPLSLHNNMGPPLSRLLQRPQHHQTEGNSSQAGSVKSFESNAGSDVVAHVDTDDCGGGLDMDVHSIHSQEDHERSENAKNNLPSNPDDDEGPNAGIAKQPINPLLCSTESNANGRTSPGGTIYKGRGNRRYKGRYMHLPLKRFHQNGVDLGEERPPSNNGVDNEEGCRHPFAVGQHQQMPQRNGGWGDGRRGRSRSPDTRRHQRDRSPRDRRQMNGSRAQVRSRSRSRDRAPQNNIYDNRKPRARRWQQHGGSGESSSRESNYRGGGSNRQWGGDNGYSNNHRGRGPCRTRSNRR